MDNPIRFHEKMDAKISFLVSILDKTTIFPDNLVERSTKDKHNYECNCH
jgi:hypothetical protein